jgi:para-nitrobenzyl esterase
MNPARLLKISRLCLLLVGAPAMAAAPRVVANGETLIGIAAPSTGVSAFLGIPFAQPPLAALRWSAPVDYVGVGGTRQARAFAPACMQTMRILDWYRDMAELFGSSRGVFADLPVSEDCLYLNVWTPANNRRAKLPVMAYIHGGSNNSGWSFEPNYHGHELAAKGAVVVSIAYRLGVFGFFSHPELANAQAKANFGLWDQLAALRWVQRNIAAFGGDPKRVTVIGESAGAGDAAALMLSPAAKGLLQRAILQSGSNFGFPVIHSLAAEQARGVELARAIDPAATPDLTTLRAIPAQELLQRAGKAFRDHYHAPVLDGDIVTAQLSEQLRRADVPLRQLIIGTNANEFYSRAPENANAQVLDTAVARAEVLNTPQVRELLAASPDIPTALDRLFTAEAMLCQAQIIAAELARSGRGVWMYRFSRVREGAAAATLKAYHGAELPYVFGTHDAWLPTTEVDRRLSGAMMRAWVQFARTGNPNSPAVPSWPAFTGTDGAQVLDLNEQIQSIEAPEQELCRIFRQRLNP